MAAKAPGARPQTGKHSTLAEPAPPSPPNVPFKPVKSPEDNDEDVDVCGDNNEKSPPSPKEQQPKKKTKKRMENTCNCEELKYVQCILETKDLWDKFHDLETEMIITKTGR